MTDVNTLKRMNKDHGKSEQAASLELAIERQAYSLESDFRLEALI